MKYDNATILVIAFAINILNNNNIFLISVKEQLGFMNTEEKLKYKVHTLHINSLYLKRSGTMSTGHSVRIEMNTIDLKALLANHFTSTCSIISFILVCLERDYN